MSRPIISAKESLKSDRREQLYAEFGCQRPIWIEHESSIVHAQLQVDIKSSGNYN